MLGLGRVELAGEMFARPLAECLFDERTGLLAGTAGKALRFDAGAAVRRDNDLDDLHGESASDLDGEFDRAVGEGLLGNGMAAAARLKPGFFDGIGLQ